MPWQINLSGLHTNSHQYSSRGSKCRRPTSWLN